jgi:dTDP-4-dehydrorhamnose reductase
VSAPNVLVLGGTGFIGRAFVEALAARGWAARVVRRTEVDYTRFTPLCQLLRAQRWDFVVNCAGYTGKPNVDACEDHRAETLLGNSLLPQTLAHACASTGLPWGHVSSGCIYSGAKVTQPDGSVRIEPDLTRPDLRLLVEREPHRIRGFTEEDPPNFSFRSPPCSFYSGSKALGEEALADAPACYVWRLRIPFDGHDQARNYLSKLQRYPRVYDNVNSISHLGDFTRACLDLWGRRAPFGTYNITNPGLLTTRHAVDLIRKHLRPDREFVFWRDDHEFYQTAAKTPRSNCVLDVSKLLATGVPLRPVEEALEDSLIHWQPEARPPRHEPA